ncbi:histidine phosphatase family protein [Photobacterium sp. OFAV2-7]|uniref:histidine phosphatase family protein n=1 Tax=Photobacterium sp. OFAV2-7 TaxID=2917748 RepID=UPI001EF629C1|nr:histidine phosphatase family protein [Photobacterium sp. OFAV2-7]MCG7584593.1 histidine phosphatase family protein [Photobacterium sp. OFAV2-7]
MKRICLVTHTEATHSIDKLVGGWYNSNLTEDGRSQAALLRDRVKEFGFKPSKLKTYSSDLNRAYQTAQIICSGNESQIVLDPRLREMSFGSNEGLPQNEHGQKIKFPPSKGNRLDHRICEGAESLRELATRVIEFVNSIMDEDGDAIIVAHGFSSSFVIAAFQKIDIESMAYIDYKLSSGSISILEVDAFFHNRSIKLLNSSAT